MRTPAPPAVFDGHNDALLRLWTGGIETAVERFRQTDTGHIDIAKARAGGFIGGFFATFPPPGGTFVMPKFEPPYDVPLPPMLAQRDALAMVVEQAAVLLRLETAGLVRICRTARDIAPAMAEGRIAAILHMEGAEAIDPDLQALDVLHAAGLRSLGIVWSRPTIFGQGVPFRYPSDADIGDGLTDAGKRLVARCKALRIMVDTSHLNMAGFWDVAEAGVPLVATHSNAHTVSPGARNLTDAQLRAIGETGGMVGLNFATVFLRADGRAAPQDCIEAAMRHLDQMIAQAGEDHVGLGSDFDGAPMPEGLENCAKLDTLRNAMRAHGYGEPLVAKICNENWLSFLDRTLT